MRLLELFEPFNNSLLEARKNPKLNPRVSAYEALLPYKNDPNVFISFTNINKLGINPLSKFSTPLGIYTYPLKETWDQYKVDQNKSFKSYPYAQKEPYIQIVKWNGKGIFMDISDYDEHSLAYDIEQLRKIYKDSYMFKIYLDNAKEEHDIPIRIFWKLCLMLAGDIKQSLMHNVWIDDKRIEKQFNVSEGARKWNSLLRKLGYAGFSDNFGHGVIHKNEPIQAFFTSIDYITHLGTVLNKDYQPSYVHPPKLYDGGYSTGVIINGKEIILSPKSTEKSLYFDDALKYVNGLTIGGKSDWILPSMEELQMLIKKGHLISKHGFHSGIYYSKDQDNEYVYGLQFYDTGIIRKIPKDHLDTARFETRAIRYANN